MKLSRREKILISILLLAVVVYFGYQYVPFDKVFKLSALEEEYRQKKSTYDLMSQNIILKTNYEKKVEELSNEINSVNMLSDLDQEKIIVFLNKYLLNNNIDANNISFTDVVAVPITTAVSTQEPKAKSTFEGMMDTINGTSKATTSNTGASQETSTSTQEVQPSQEQADGASTVNSVSVNIAFKSNYSDMIKFIDSIQSNPIDIAITNINTLSQDGGILQGTMTLNFYAVPKLEGFTEQNKDWIWEDLMQSGKSNPFSLEGGVLYSSSGGSYDFYMSSKPESSDLPTIMLGKTNDESRTTFVYADSNKIEDVLLQFKKDNSKYYYRLETVNDSYPKDGSWEEFVPSVNGSINIKINSNEKNSKADSAGANVSVKNTSGLKVRFEIENDDKTSPRIFFKDSKSFVVIRK